MSTPIPTAPSRGPIALLSAATGLALLALGCDGNLTQPAGPSTYTALAQEPLACLPNLDGRIEAHELAPTLQQLAAYRVTPPLGVPGAASYPVDLRGAIDSAGHRVWDWSQADSADQVASLSAEPVASQWYADQFPAGTFAVPSDAGLTLDGIYSHSDSGLLLHGIASRLQDPPEGRTLLVYSEPIVFFPFPFEVGSSWTALGEVRNGWLRGLHPWSQDDTYEVHVREAGELRLPDFTFGQALRVYTLVTVKPKAGTVAGYTQHQQSFVFECFGEVARATSALITDAAADPGELFDEAAEIRRLGWF